MNKTTRSYIIYFGIFIVCFLLAGRAEKTRNKKLVFWIALILSFFMGFRSRTVGIDSKNYYYMFNSMTELSVAKRYNDPGFYQIAYFLMKIIKDPYFPFVVLSSLSCFLVVYRTWEQRNFISFQYGILRYMSLFYYYQANCMRQFAAMAIVFWATRYLERKDYLRFLIYVAIASVFHLAALTATAYITLEKLRWKDLDVRSQNFVNASYLLLPLSVTLMFIISKGRLDQYLSSPGGISYGFRSYLLKIALFAVVLYYTLRNHKNLFKNNDNIRMCFVYYAIGMLLSGLGFRFAQFERIGYFFYTYSITYIGYLATEKKYRSLFRLALLVITVRSFYVSLSMNAMGQMPYLFNWE